MDGLNKLFKCVSSPKSQIGIRSMVVHVEETKNKHFFIQICYRSKCYTMKKEVNAFQIIIGEQIA